LDPGDRARCVERQYLETEVRVNRYQKTLIVLVLLLLGVGLLMVYSTSAIASSGVHQGGSFILRQALWLVMGLVAMCLIMRVDYHYYEKWRLPMLVLAFATLVMVLIPGIAANTNGARRWVRMGPIGFQPSEFCKVALILYMAAILSRKQQRIKEFFNGFVPPVIVLFVAFSLIVCEPDFGTALLIFVVIFAMMFVAGIRLRHVAPLCLVALPIFWYLVVKVPYRLDRILAFTDPWKYSDGIGYHIVQSLIAIGSGGMFGKGLGAGQQKLFFLPERHTDFIYAVLCEETGFVGGVIVLILFGLLLWQGMRIAHRAPDLYGFLVGFGITLMVGLQALVNLAVVTASMPTKGIALPLISYGGSSLFFTLVGMGILLNVAKQGEQPDELRTRGARLLRETDTEYDLDFVE